MTGGDCGLDNMLSEVQDLLQHSEDNTINIEPEETRTIGTREREISLGAGPLMGLTVAAIVLQMSYMSKS